MAIFFGLYGPEGHVIEEEIYEKNIEEPNANLTFIRLRVAAKTGKKADVKNAFLAIIRNHRNLVWDYETMITFNVNGDLGPRFGSNNSPQTLRFIRYWDAGCRYILSILSMPGNWIRDVDVWGVPHLINNSIGASLRPERNPIICQNCQAHMYMKTSLDAANLPAPIQHIQVPVFVFFCPNCGNQSLISSNI
jgi:hypothetical protein